MSIYPWRSNAHHHPSPLSLIGCSFIDRPVHSFLVLGILGGTWDRRVYESLSSLGVTTAYTEARVFLAAYSSDIHTKGGFHVMFPDIHGSFLRRGAGSLLIWMMQTQHQQGVNMFACTEVLPTSVLCATCTLNDQLTCGLGQTGAVEDYMTQMNSVPDFVVTPCDRRDYPAKVPKQSMRYGQMYFMDMRIVLRFAGQVS